MKTYLYTDLINDNYFYTINNNDITIFKDCNNNQCSCEKVFINNDYLRSNVYSCTLNNDISLNSSIFTDNFYYRLDFYKILIIFIILCIFIFLIPIKILFRFFKRFN